MKHTIINLDHLDQNVRNLTKHQKKKLMFIGYTNSVTNYGLHNPKTEEIIITNDVKFNEDRMYYDWFKTSRCLSDKNFQSHSSSNMNMN